MTMKKKRQKRIFPRAVGAALAVAMLCLPLASCGFVEINYPGGGTTAAETTAATTPPATPSETSEPPKVMTFPDRTSDAANALAALPSVELGTADLIIANSYAAPELFAPAEDDTLNAARRRRTELACARYDINLTVTRADDAELLAALQKNAAAGDYYADLSVIPATSAALYFNASIAANLRELPFFVTPSDHHSAAGAGIAGSSCYFYCGDAVFDPDSIMTLYFNRTTAGAELTDSLYRRALGEGLTWEDLFTATAGRTVLCGDDGADTAFAADILCATLGIEFVSHPQGKSPTVNCDLDALATANTLIGRLASVCEISGESFDKFTRGEALFRFGTVSDIRRLYSLDCEWGILPVPMASTDGGYITLGAETRPVIACVGGAGRTELCGAALAALDAASGAWLGDAYADAALDTCLRDNNSYLTLRRVLDSDIRFDFAYLYAGATDELYGATIGAIRSCFEGRATLPDAIKNARSGADRELARIFE